MIILVLLARITLLYSQNIQFVACLGLFGTTRVLGRSVVRSTVRPIIFFCFYRFPSKETCFNLKIEDFILTKSPLARKRIVSCRKQSMGSGTIRIPTRRFASVSIPHMPLFFCVGSHSMDRIFFETGPNHVA